MTISTPKPGISFGLPFPKDESALRLDFDWGKVILVDLATGALPLLWEGKTASPVATVKFSPDGNTLATCGLTEGAPVELWDVASGQVLKTLTTGAANGQNAIAFAPDGKSLALVLNNSGGLQVWDLASGKQRDFAGGVHERVVSVAYSPDGKLIATGLAPGKYRQGHTDITDEVKLWDAQTGSLVKTLSWRKTKQDLGQFVYDAVDTLAFSPQGGILAAGTCCSVELFDVQTGNKTQSLPCRNGIGSIAFSHSGRIVAAGTRDTSVLLFDAAAGKLNGYLENYNRDGAVEFSPDDRFVAVTNLNVAAPGNEVIGLWDFHTLKLAQQFKGHTGSVSSISFSPDGKTIASCGDEDHTVKLWRVDALK